MLRRLALLILLLAPLGCAAATGPDDEAGVRLVVDRAVYRTGDTLVARLVNDTGQRVGYNLCGSAREQWTGGEWRLFASLRVCTLELRILEPGGAAEHREAVEAGAPGRNRFVTTVELMSDGRSVRVVSDPFTVEP